jgi:hypothetical protein
MLAFARVRLPGQSRKWHTLFRGRSALAIEDFERVAARRDWDQDHEEDRKKRLETGSARPSGLIPVPFHPNVPSHPPRKYLYRSAFLALTAG